MTAELTVPAAVWACQQPGVPFVAAVVEGDHASDYIDRTKVVNPPAWLVALRDARCRCVCHVVAPAQGVHCWDRCHDGRLLHDVRVEMIPYSYHGDPCPCGLDPDDHYRTVRCLIDVVEVVGWHDCTDRTAHVCVGNDAWTASGVIFHTVLDQPGETEHLLTPAHVDALAAACGKPPADWVGKYAVVLTTTNQEAE